MKNLWSKIAPVISPGIRLKLTIFTLFFCLALLLFSYFLNYFRQSEQLRVAFEEQVKAPQEFVGGFVSELNKLSDALVRLEDFRINLEQKTAELRQYKKAVAVKQASTLKDVGKFFGFSVKYKYEVRRFDTYYSTYLNDKNLKDFESQVKSLVDNTVQRQLTAVEFKELQRLAYAIARARHRKEVADGTRLFDALKRHTNLQWSSRLSSIGLNAETVRIISYDTDRKKVFDTGDIFPKNKILTQKLLDYDKFRAFVEGYFKDEKVVRLSDKFRFKDSEFQASFAPVYQNPAVSSRCDLLNDPDKDQLKLLQPAIDEDRKFSSEIAELAHMRESRFEEIRKLGTAPAKDKEFVRLTADYKALINKRQQSLQNLLGFEKLRKAMTEQKNKDIRANDQNLAQLAKREKELKDQVAQLQKNGGKPAADGKSLGELNDQLYVVRQEIETEKIRKVDLASHKEDISKERLFAAAEAMLELRDAALMNRVRLSLSSQKNEYAAFVSSEAERKDTYKRYQAVRDFIYAGLSETEIPPVQLGRARVSPLAGGILAISRSEAEKNMHTLDATPLVAAKQEDSLAWKLSGDSIEAYNLTIIDKSSGLKKIAESAFWLAVYSGIIALIAIIAAWYFSGVAVRRIASLSSTSGQVKNGNLNVTFDGKGYDELAILGQSLNGMVEGLKEREELKGELMAAEEIQKRLLPATVPKNLKDRADIAGFYKAMVGIGGDYFDYLALGPDIIAIAMGDVSNHGVGPALVMAVTRSQLHALLREKEISLKNIMLKLNEQLYLDTPANIFVTFFVALYNLKTGELQYISAGHSKPLLYDAEKGQTRYLDAGGMPLGMDDNDFFADTLEVRKIKLSKGDVFLQYTDGLSEAMNPAREQFGYERMEKILEKTAAQSTEKILATLTANVEKFAVTKLSEPGPSDLSDDIALVCLKRL